MRGGRWHVGGREKRCHRTASEQWGRVAEPAREVHRVSETRRRHARMGRRRGQPRRPRPFERNAIVQGPPKRRVQTTGPSVAGLEPATHLADAEASEHDEERDFAQAAQAPRRLGHRALLRTVGAGRSAHHQTSWLGGRRKNNGSLRTTSCRAAARQRTGGGRKGASGLARGGQRGVGSVTFFTALLAPFAMATCR